MSKMKTKLKSKKLLGKTKTLSKTLGKSSIKSAKKVSKRRLKPEVNGLAAPEEEPSSTINSDIEAESSSEDELETIVNYKKTLEGLKDKDSEFYEFLQQNDKQLLDFDVSDEEVDEDQEDFDTDGDETDSKVKLSVNQIDEWSTKLKEKSDIETIKSVVRCFRRAVDQTDGQKNDQLIDTEVFNGIINVCLIDLLPAIHRLLKLPQIGSNESTDVRTIDPTKSRNWKKMISVMKCYLTDVIKMIAFVSDDSLKSSLLRHILHLVPFIIRYPHLIKRVLKQTIILWSESNETNRILAFICILRVVRTQEQQMISFILKKLYISYVKNSKFTTEDKQSVINFMKLSLVELYSLDSFVAYQHSFVFIRQLAINLRTAMTLKKKESYKTVYNWQFLHSIQLWTQLLCSHNSIEELKPLICPLVNVIIGTIRLIPSPKLLPMRFHLINALIKLSEETNTFIPVLPLITEALDHLEMSKKKSDNKPINLDLLIKVSQMKISGNEFTMAVVSKVYDLILHYLSSQSHQISFPELVYLTTNKVRKFLKNSHSPQTLQSLKQLVEKIEENSKFINDKRKNVEFSVDNSLAINSWERQLKSEGTPLMSFYIQRKRLQSDSDKKTEKLDLKNLTQEDKLTKLVAESDLRKQNKSKKRRTDHEETGKDRNNEVTANRPNKRTKKFKKGKQNSGPKKNTNSLSDSFELNQALDMSSDESE